MRPPHLGSLFPLFIEPVAINACDQSPIGLSTATGCLYSHGGKTFLVTNWHVLSGRNSKDLTPLDTKYSALPQEIRVHFPKGQTLEECQVQSYPLHDQDGEPIWLEHTLANQVDVAALCIEPPAEIATIPVSDAYREIGLVAPEDFFFVTQDVWVVGFPKSIRVGVMPIWKRATIAAEPRFSSASEKHKLLIDTATREGMSGSPVLYVNKTLSRLSFDNSSLEVDFPSEKLLLGIYSGRIAGNDELAAQLGIVWSAEAIVEILTSGRRYVPQYG